MYNRFVYERDQKQSLLHKRIQTSLEKLNRQHHQSNQNMSHLYKARVNDFLVKMASNPFKLSQYLPPITNITRSPNKGKIISNGQLYINGFKTNRQRIQKAIEDQKILDLNPIIKSKSETQFRSRVASKEIQPQMKFRNATKSTLKSTPLYPKMHFKAIEQFGNNLQSMKQQGIEMTGLINRLQTIAGPRDVNPVKLSMETLKVCNLLKTKTII